MFADVNENDAKAAVKVWTQILINERGVPVDPDARLLNGVAGIAEAFRGGLIDGIAMQTDEYVALHETIAFGTFIPNMRNGQPTEEYVVLAHRESGVSRLADLKGRNLSFLQSPKMSLAFPWLETLLLQENFGRMDGFFGQITRANKLSKVVLPVFFQKIEACVVTRHGFDTMRELNPKVGQQLKVVAASPPFVTGGFYIRSTYSSIFKEKILREIEQMHLSPAGQQVLTIFQSEKLERRPISILDNAVELVATHRRLLPATKTAAPVKTNTQTRGGPPLGP